MKIEPKELLDIVAQSATELVNENTELSEEILTVMRMMTQRISDKLFKMEVSDLGLSEKEIDEFLTSKNKETKAE